MLRSLTGHGFVWAYAATIVLTASAAGQEGDRLLADANQRIENHRQADARIVVLDAQGNKVANADVTAEQVSHKFLFGCNIFLWGRVGSDEDEQAYRQRFAEVFNFATLGFYWPSYERSRGQPAHDHASQVARWCREHNIATKGHPLAWNYSDPAWLPDDSTEIRTLQMARIDDCVARFRGLIDRWDVVNEATHFEREQFKQRSPKMTKMWSDAGRIEFVHECFGHARQANPAATLLINDYRTGSGFEALVKQLKDDQGKRLYDVIGIQSHMHTGTWDNRRLWEVCQRFAQFSVPLHFTETTILSGEAGWERGRGGRSWTTTDEGERWQADEVERVYTMIFSHPAVEALTWWDFSDRNAWQRAPAGFLRKDMSPKPAYERLHDLIKNRWWTRSSGQTSEAGEWAFRGFLGDYRITINGPEGAQAVKEVTIDKQQPNRVVVKLSGKTN